MNNKYCKLCLGICILLSFVRGIICLGVTTYLVFWKDFSGAWYILGILLTWGDCNPYRSPEQIEASKKDEE